MLYDSRFKLGRANLYQEGLAMMEIQALLNKRKDYKFSVLSKLACIIYLKINNKSMSGIMAGKYCHALDEDLLAKLFVRELSVEDCIAEACKHFSAKINCNAKSIISNCQQTSHGKAWAGQNFDFCVEKAIALIHETVQNVIDPNVPQPGRVITFRNQSINEEWQAPSLLLKNIDGTQLGAPGYTLCSVSEGGHYAAPDILGCTCRCGGDETGPDENEENEKDSPSPSSTPCDRHSDEWVQYCCGHKYCQKYASSHQHSVNTVCDLCLNLIQKDAGRLLELYLESLGNGMLTVNDIYDGRDALPDSDLEVNYPENVAPSMNFYATIQQLGERLNYFKEKNAVITTPTNPKDQLDDLVKLFQEQYVHLLRCGLCQKFFSESALQAHHDECSKTFDPSLLQQQEQQQQQQPPNSASFEQVASTLPSSSNVLFPPASTAASSNQVVLQDVYAHIHDNNGSLPPNIRQQQLQQQ
eukprot:Awhi_evm1s4632